MKSPIPSGSASRLRKRSQLLGIQGVPEILYTGEITGMPTVTIGGGVTAISQFSHLESNQRTWDIFDNVTLLRGRHSIKAGMSLRKDVLYLESWPKPGTFNFSGFFTGFGLADFLLGLPFTSQRDYPRAALGPTIREGWYNGWYVQDDFKVGPRLTLNFGLRWDISLPGRETHDLFYNFDPRTGNLVVPTQEAINQIVPTFPSSVTAVTADQAGFPGKLRKTDWNNFAPRLGIAWRPFGEDTVLRAAYGLYIDGLSLGYIPTDGPWGGSETFTNRLENGVPLWQFPAAYPSGVAGQRPGTVAITAYDVDLRNPYVQQWNLTLERQLKETVVRVQYVGTKSTHLYWLRDINLPEPSTTPFSDSRRPYPQYGAITSRTNGGNSTYHAMTLGAERCLRQGFTFNSYWTFSKMMTDSYEAGGETTALEVGRWFPTFQRSKWKGNETHNPRHRWTTTWYSELPFGRGRHFGADWDSVTNFIAGGWALSGIYNIQSGWWVAPYYSSGADSAGVQFTQGVPDRIANGVLSNKGLHPGQLLLDPKAFVMPPANAGRFGTSSVNFMQEPPWWSFDIGIEKTFPIHEQVKFEFLCKIINVFNHGIWSGGAFNVGLNLASPGNLRDDGDRLRGEPADRFPGKACLVGCVSFGSRGGPGWVDWHTGSCQKLNAPRSPAPDER